MPLQTNAVLFSFWTKPLTLITPINYSIFKTWRRNMIAVSLGLWTQEADRQWYPRTSLNKKAQRKHLFPPSLFGLEDGSPPWLSQCGHVEPCHNNLDSTWVCLWRNSNASWCGTPQLIYYRELNRVHVLPTCICSTGYPIISKFNERYLVLLIKPFMA